MNTNVSKNSIIQRLNQTTAAQLAGIPEVADRFKRIYEIMNGGDAHRAELKYEAEKFHFMKLLQDKKDLQKCTKLSLYGCFLDMAVNGLSFDPSMKHAYVVGFNTNVGTRQSPKWEKRATLMISGYGELHMRIQQNQIKYADNPILVFEGDEFKYGTREGKVFLEHVAAFPRKSENIIACYIRLERNDGSVDYKVLSIEEVMKIRNFSKDPNSKAWTDGLPGMVQAKTIKHAFRSYPKIRMGEFTQLQSQIVDAENEPQPVIDYGINEEKEAPDEAPSDHEPEMVHKQEVPPDDASFTKLEESPGQGQVYEDDEF